MRYYTEYESPLGTIIMLSEGAALTGLYMLEGNRYVDTILSGTEDKVNVFVKPDEQRIQDCLNTMPWRENEGEANVFDKPNEQRQACLISAMARKRTFKNIWELFEWPTGNGYL